MIGTIRKHPVRPSACVVASLDESFPTVGLCPLSDAWTNPEASRATLRRMSLEESVVELEARS